MKKLFKIPLICFMISFLFALNGCTAPMFNFVPHDISEIASIQLIYYDNPDVLKQEYTLFEAKHPFESFDESKCTVLEELDRENLETFFSEMEYSVESSTVSTRGPIGQGLRVNHTDGKFFVIIWNYVEESHSYRSFNAYYQEDGTLIIDSCDSIEAYYYMILAANYFETKIR